MTYPCPACPGPLPLSKARDGLLNPASGLFEATSSLTVSAGNCETGLVHSSFWRCAQGGKRAGRARGLAEESRPATASFANISKRCFKHFSRTTRNAVCLSRCIKMRSMPYVG